MFFRRTQLLDLFSVEGAIESMRAKAAEAALIRASLIGVFQFNDTDSGIIKGNLMPPTFIYSDKFGSYVYATGHPMKPARLKLTYDLICALGLDKPNAGGKENWNIEKASERSLIEKSSERPRLAGKAAFGGRVEKASEGSHLEGKAAFGGRVIEARQARETELLLFHTPEYLNVLRQANSGALPPNGTAHGLGHGDNPVFTGMYDWSCWSAGASLQAADLIIKGEAVIAFNIAGGLHHAMPNRASGFCYINDVVVAIKHLVNAGKRVAYIDIDAHHGDGVEYAFYDSSEVLTISLHEDGQWLFPGTGAVTDIGINQGRGYAVNLPFPPYAGDTAFVAGFNAIVPKFVEAFSPDVIVTQLGVDTFATDPITHLELTTNGFEMMVRSFKSFNVPWVALGGGGYDLSNVARAWTLAWAIMTGAEPSDEIPSDFIEANAGSIFSNNALRDAPNETPPMAAEDDRTLSSHIEYLLNTVLPLVKAG